MRYLMLLYTNDAEWQALGTTEEAIVREHFELIKNLKQNGTYRTSDALAPATSATTVRVRDGKTLVSDGPFAETKEMLGGYYVIEAPNLDDAIAIAARIPDARAGSVEVRPIREFA
jgi:hypothetical protein